MSCIMKISSGFQVVLVIATFITLCLLTIFISHHVVPPFQPAKFFERFQNNSTSSVVPKTMQDYMWSGQWSVAQKLDMLPDTQVTRVDCVQLMAGNQTEVTRAEKLQQAMTPARVNFTRITSNCTHFRASRGYIEYAVSQEEEDFPLAFTIVMYRDAEQAERLLRAIYRPQNHYCIHIDRFENKSLLTDMRAISSCFPNMAVASQLVHVQWGTSSVVDAEFACMADLWLHTRWRYLINLTGQEFPLKTNMELVRILRTLRGANFIGNSGVPKRRTKYVFKKLKPTIRKSPPPHGIHLFYGSMKMAMSREFVDYLLHSQVVSDFREWVSDTYVPDETFFSTLNHNPQLGVPGAFTGTPQGSYHLLLTRYVLWKGHGNCYGRWMRLVCIFGVRDLESLSQRPEMFVNKFHMDYQPLAYDCMEELHFNRTRLEILGHKPGHLNMTLYENLPFAQQHVD